MRRVKVGHHVFSCRSLLLNTIVLNDIYIMIFSVNIRILQLGSPGCL